MVEGRVKDQSEVPHRTQEGLSPLMPYTELGNIEEEPALNRRNTQGSAVDMPCLKKMRITYPEVLTTELELEFQT